MTQHLETTLYGQVRYQGEFDNPRDGILAIEDSLNMEIAQRTPEIPKPQPARSDIQHSGGNIGQQTHPGNAWTSATGLNGSRKLIMIQKTGKIDARMGAKRMITPSACVDVQQFELPVSRI